MADHIPLDIIEEIRRRNDFVEVIGEYLELKGSGVRATLIEPAATDTPLWDTVDRARNPGLPQREAMLAPDAVAACVLFALGAPAEQSINYLGVERS